MKPRIAATVGWVYLIAGVVLAANAVVSGPHAFAGKRSAVVVLVLSGGVLSICGAALLREARCSVSPSRASGPE